MVLHYAIDSQILCLLLTSWLLSTLLYYRKKLRKVISSILNGNDGLNQNLMQKISDTTSGVKHQKDGKSSRLVQQLVDKNGLLQNEDIRRMLSSDDNNNSHLLLHGALERLDSDYRRFVLSSLSHYEFLAEHAAKEHYEEDAAKYRLLKALFKIIFDQNWTADSGGDDNNNGK